MSSKGSSSNWAVFGHAAWDVLTNLELDYHVHTTLAFWPSYRRGVFVIEAVGTKVMTGGEARDICRTQAEFPNARAETLEAFLYALTTKIAHCVQAWEADNAAQVEKAGS